MNTNNELIFSKYEQEHLHTFLDDMNREYTTSYPYEECTENKTAKLAAKMNNVPGGIQVNQLMISDSGKRSGSTRKCKKRESYSSKRDEYNERDGKRARKQPHQLLSDEQKKANHIASEQKRRANIRIGFEKLIDIVPTLSNSHKSEAVILQNSVDYLRHLIEVKRKLKESAQELQLMLGDIPDDNSSEDELDYL